MTWVDLSDIYVEKTGSTISMLQGLASNAKLLAGPKIGSSMLSHQTVTLNEPVSQQAHGIVLHWAAYLNGEIKNYDHVYTFIPKRHVLDCAGEGVIATMATSGFQYVASKYIYVKDRTIIGSDVNGNTGIGSSGIKYDNTHWALDSVIGV